MNDDENADRDNWVRLTLRLPRRLHAELTKQADVLSLNALIVQKLEQGEENLKMLKTFSEGVSLARRGIEQERRAAAIQEKSASTESGSKVSYQDIRNALIAELEDRMQERFAEWTKQIQLDEIANNQLADPDYRDKR
jgi:hypothetical protein